MGIVKKLKLLGFALGWEAGTVGETDRRSPRVVGDFHDAHLTPPPGRQRTKPL